MWEYSGASLTINRGYAMFLAIRLKVGLRSFGPPHRGGFLIREVRYEE